MLNIQRFVVNMIQENCYILWDDTKECAIIDCGAFYPEEKEAIKIFIKEKELHPSLLLNTHLHFDHIFGNPFLYETYGLETQASEKDLPLYQSFPEQLKDFIGLTEYATSMPPIKKFIDDKDTVSFGTHMLQVIATPGNTPGGLDFYCAEENVLFSGDSLFRHSIGRMDFPGGDYSNLVTSLKEKILTLPDDVKILTGHGLSTTIRSEKKENPYFIV